MVKRRIVFLAGVGTAFCAVAQTSQVTLYGVIDAGVEFANKQPGRGNSVARVTSGNLAGSRWGLRGQEDLGGGLKAVFALESGFEADSGMSGQGGRLFGRQAFVGLQNNLGTLTLGRHMTPIYDFGIKYDPMTTATKYSIFTQDFGFVARADNSVKYTAAFGPVSTYLLYSVGAESTRANGSEVPGNYRIGREYSGRVDYSSDGLSVGVVFDEINVGTTTTNPDAKLRRLAVAGTYEVASAQVYGGYRWARGYNGAVLPGASAGLANQGSNLYWLGLGYNVTPALRMTGAAYYQDFKATGADPWLFSLQADYAFSKRTDAYLAFGYTKNKENSALGLSNGSNGFGQTLAGANQAGVTAGIRHRF